MRFQCFLTEESVHLIVNKLTQEHQLLIKLYIITKPALEKSAIN